MSTPPYPYIPAPFQTQDFSDDDAQIIDDLYKENSSPADIKQALIPSTGVPQYNAKAPSRVLANSVRFQQVNLANILPTQILAEDLNRGTCRVRVWSDAAALTIGDYVIFADDPGKISGGAISINVIGRHNQEICFDGHTGRLFAYPSATLAANSTIEVTAWGMSTNDGTQLNNV